MGRTSSLQTAFLAFVVREPIAPDPPEPPRGLADIGWPDRMYLVHDLGKVAYNSGAEPFAAL